MPGFDPFAFVGDVAKGVGDVAKGVGDIANNAAKIAAGAVDGAIKAMASEGNEGEQKSLEDHHEEPRPIPEPQYRDCEIDAFYVEKRYVAVRQITVGANGEPLEGYRHYLRLSRHGVERVQTADLFAKPMERIRVRNCTLFKNGEAAGEDALKKGAFFGSVATLFSFHPLAIGFFGCNNGSGQQGSLGIGYPRLRRKGMAFHGGVKRRGRRPSEVFGSLLYGLAAYLRLWLLAAVRCLNCKRAAIN